MRKTLASLVLGVSLIFGGCAGFKTENVIQKQYPIVSGIVKNEHFHSGIIIDEYRFSIKTDDERIILFNGYWDPKKLDGMIDKGDSIKIRLREPISQDRGNNEYIALSEDVFEINGVKNPSYRER